MNIKDKNDQVVYRFNNGCPVVDDIDFAKNILQSQGYNEVRREENSCFILIIGMNTHSETKLKTVFVKKPLIKTIKR